MPFEGREKYELELDRIKNTPMAQKSKRSAQLAKWVIKPAYKKDWSIGVEEAEAAQSLDLETRLKELTFDYIIDKSKPESVVKRKEANNSQSSSKQKKRKKSNHPSDIYDFNDNEDDIDQDNFSPTLLWSQKRADRKGDFKVFCSRMKDQIVKENPELNEEEIDKLLSSKWDLLSDDFKAQYRPLEPFSTPNSKLNQKSSNSRKSLPKSNRKRKLDKSASPAVLNDKPKMEDKSKEAKDSGLSEDETALIIDEPTTPKKSRNRASLKSATSTPISSKVLKSNRSKSSSKTQEKPPLPKKPKSLSIKHRFDKLESEPDTNLKTPKVSAKQANATSTKKSESKRASLKSVSLNKTPKSVTKTSPKKEKLKREAKEESEAKKASTKSQPKNVLTNQLPALDSEETLTSEDASSLYVEPEANEKPVDKVCELCHEIANSFTQCSGSCLKIYHENCVPADFDRAQQMCHECVTGTFSLINLKANVLFNLRFFLSLSFLIS